MEHCKWFPKPTKVETHLTMDENFPETKLYWPNMYAFP